MGITTPGTSANEKHLQILLSGWAALQVQENEGQHTWAGTTHGEPSVPKMPEGLRFSLQMGKQWQRSDVMLSISAGSWPAVPFRPPHLSAFLTGAIDWFSLMQNES